MTGGQSLNTKALMLSGGILFFAASGSVWADYDWSYCNATGNISIPNINLKAGNLSVNQDLQTITQTFAYVCKTMPRVSGPSYYQANLFLDASLTPMVNALKGTGFGMDITVQEDGQNPIDYKWPDIKKGFSGHAVSKPFGKMLDQKPPHEYTLQGTISLHFFVEQPFTSTIADINIPASTAFNIVPYNPSNGNMTPSVPYTRLGTSAFHIRLIPDNIGKVVVSPSVVSMGHIYTTDNNSLTKETPFTVTAQQNLGTQTPFTVPLQVEFQTNGLTLTNTDNAVILQNTKGEANGFKLSVVNEAGNLVKFNTKTDMGDIKMNEGASGNIVKKYTAKLEHIPGEEIKTGIFSAAMTIVITYN
ncbi:TPA: fimbrial protein [Salmonella enterica]|uniref:Fimbrial protein n=1 Tax=Salmonella enterica TaxID=28901 RepID=A0A759RP68_SALER|nr:fimbrial protein [Salmonella enterica]